MDFLFDTCAINCILKREVENGWSLRGDCYVTDIQLQEILETRNPSRRRFLLTGLMNLRLTVIRPTDTYFPYDCGENFDSDHRIPGTFAEAQYPEMSLGRLVPVIARGLPPNQKKPQNPLRDAFLAEAALLNGLILVTADKDLAARARTFGVHVELISQRLRRALPVLDDA
jgi:hypothetical protein